MKEKWGVSKAGGTLQQRSHLWRVIGNGISKSRCGLLSKTADICGEMRDTRCARCVKSDDRWPEK
jgi:hypothetical protein